MKPNKTTKTYTDIYQNKELIGLEISEQSEIYTQDNVEQYL